MGYQLRMHDEVRDWLARLRDDDPVLARLVGEAVLALMDAGQALGPPLVVPLESVLGRPEDPRAALDYSYQRQLEILTGVRRGIADVATSRKRLELQLSALEQQVAKLAAQREKAIGAGREDLAAEAREREGAVQEQFAPLRRQYQLLTGEEQRLTLAGQRLQAKVEAFRIRKETLKASYTASEAAAAVRQAMADLRAEAGEPGEPSGEEEPAPAPAGEAEPPRKARGRGPGAQDGSGPGVVPPPGTMVLLPGAPEDHRVGLLFTVVPPDAAVLLAHVADPGQSIEDYQAAARAAAERVPSGPAADGFTAYLPESFLDEFFAGAETEVEIAAGALAARSRGYTLAEARQRMRLTQAQVALRMNVRQERVSAIERAEPGATEIRTLAAYVGALGGRLEIIAHIGDERITLR
jgi:PspA/IM30 family protein/helix-turn-helix protein